MGRAVRGAAAPFRGDSGLIRIKEEQMSRKGAGGSKECAGLSWSLFIDLVYSRKRLESSSALMGSLSFFLLCDITWPVAISDLPRFVIFLRILEGWN